MKKIKVDLTSVHIRPAKILLVIVSVAGGILFSSQWRTRIVRVINPIQPYTSLTVTRDALTEEQTRLKSEINNITKSIDLRTKDLAIANQVDQVIVSESSKVVELAGLTDVSGEGVAVTLDDSSSYLLKEQSIAHAADIRDIVSLLKRAGAEAISINGERVVSMTAIDCIVNTILINETRVSNPYEIQAIGDKNHLYRVLTDPAILQDLHRRVVGDGIIFEVNKENELFIDAYSGRLPGINARVAI